MTEPQEPFEDPAATDAAAALRRIEHEVADRRELLDCWARLSPEKRQVVLMLLREMMQGETR